jgi:O-antigen/teichoic acid export membrane protein
LFGYIAVWLLGEFVPRISEELTLFYILSLTIIFTGIGVPWFYQGVEDFLFVTVRGLIIRVLFALCLFVFVRDKSDLLIYGLIIVGSTVGNNLINFIHLRKYVQLSRVQWKQLNITKHIKPAFRIFLLTVVISIYVRLNIIMLGFMTDDRMVGFFTAGMKLTYLIRVVVTSLGAVMLPRCSHLIGEKKFDEFNAVITKSYHLMMFSAIPLTIGIILLARPITLAFCGADFADTIPVVIYTAPTIVFISITNIIGIQILYPYGKENLVIISTIVAAVLNVILNILLIPPFAAIGAAISTVISEFAVLLVQVKLGKNYIPFPFLDKQIGGYLFAAAIMALGVQSCMLADNIWWQLLLATFVGALLYTVILFARQEPILFEVFKVLRLKSK